MKKNFFKKKLASGLALALVIASLAPAGISASAATATKIVKKGGAAAPTVLYVGDKGTDYNLSNEYKTNTYNWKISNSKLATINAKTGVVTPKAPGTVTIRVTARNAKTNKWLKDFTQKVYIKQRVESVNIGSEDFELVMGTEKDLNAVKTPKTSTDVLVYASSDEKVATVDAKTGVVKTVAPGEATITVYAKGLSSSPITSKYNRTDSVKVTVVDGIQSIKQLTATKVNFVFGSDQSEKLTASDLTITDVNGIKQVIKSISFSEDGKTATVVFYVELTDKAVYKVVYDEKETTFTASKGDVASVVVAGKTVQYATETPFDVTLLDANGVDVTSSTVLNNNVTFEYDTTEAFISFDASAGKYVITAFNYPKSITVTAIYHTYKYVDGVETTFKGVGVINSVEEIVDTASSIAYTLTNTGSADWKTVKTSIPATGTGYQLFVKATDDSTSADLDELDFTYESTDADILTVYKDASGVYVYPVKAGVAYIKATYGKTVRLLQVTVGAASSVATVTPDKTSATLYSSLAGDAVTFTLTGKDQYGSEISYGSNVIGVTRLTGDSVGVLNYGTPLAGDNTITFNISGLVDSTNDGVNTYKLTFLDKVVVVSINVVNVTNTTSSYIGIERSDATLDAVLTDTATASTSSTFTVYAYNNVGQKVRVVTDAALTVTLNGASVAQNDLTAKAFWLVNPSGQLVFDALNVTAGAAKQAAIGTYVIKADDVNDTNKSITSTVVVSNSQVAPTVVRDTTSTTQTGVLDAIKAALTIKVGSVALADTSIVDATYALNNTTYTYSTAAIANQTAVAGQTITIKTITVQQTTTAGTTLDTTITLNLGVTVTN